MKSSEASEEFTNWWAGTDKVSVTVDVIDSSYTWEDLSSSVNPRYWISSLLSGVWMFPIVTEEMLEGMWGVLEYIVVFIGLTIFDLFNFFSDRFHSMDKSV